MPDRDQQAPEESGQRDLEEDARRTNDLPDGSNPDSPQHKSAKKNLDDAKSDDEKG